MKTYQRTSRRLLSVVGILAMGFVFVNCDRNHEFVSEEGVNVVATQPVTTNTDGDTGTGTNGTTTTIIDGTTTTIVDGNNDGYELTDDTQAGIGSGGAATCNTGCPVQFASAASASQSQTLSVSTVGAFYNPRTWEMASDENLDSEVYTSLTYSPNNRVSGSSAVVSNFNRLRALDTSGGEKGSDGVVDSFDSEFENLRLWIDHNGNGVVESDIEAASELMTLQQAGISSISLNTLSEFNESTESGDFGPKAVVRFDTKDASGNVRRGIIFENTSR